MRKQIRAGLRSLRKRRKIITVVTLPAILLGVNVPPGVVLVEGIAHQQLINSAEYQAGHGRWDVVELPGDLQINAIHAALLATGKLLVVAGSGNDRAGFDAGTFRTLVYDPANGQSRLVPTPTDLFCSGHAFLPDGKLLVAGGTQRYELLERRHARRGRHGGEEREPEHRAHLRQGHQVRRVGRAQVPGEHRVHVAPAVKTIIKKGAKVTPSQTTVFVESEVDGPAA